MRSQLLKRPERANIVEMKWREIEPEVRFDPNMSGADHYEGGALERQSPRISTRPRLVRNVSEPEYPTSL
jgi:hypothetical protein